MRFGLNFRSWMMSNGYPTLVSGFCDVETGNLTSVHSTNTYETVESYYGYSNAEYYGDDAEAECLLVKWHRNANDGELSLIFVLNSVSPTNTKGGSIRIRVTNVNGTSRLAVSDDTGEVTVLNGNTEYVGNFAWGAPKTDGFVIAGISDDIVDNLVIEVTNPTGISKWKIQNTPTSFTYVGMDKMPSFSFDASQSAPCDRFFYPDGEAIIVNNSTDRQEALSVDNSPPSQADIFNQWGRFAGASYYPSGTPPQGEATAWTYDNQTDQIICTMNSSSYIGFVSQEQLEHFEFTATLSSADPDNDLVSMVIAFRTNQNGEPLTLSVGRTHSGLGESWYLFETNAGARTILVGGGSLAPGSNAWKDNGSTTVKIIRRGNQITAITSQFGSATLDPDTTLTYDIPTGSPFEGPASYGVSCQSQNQATFSNLQYLGGLDRSVVYDVTTTPPTAYSFQNGSWVEDPSIDIFEELGTPRYVTNPDTGITYLLDNGSVTVV